MKRISCAAVALSWLLFPAISYAQVDVEKATRYAAQAAEYYRQGDFKEAELYYNSAIKSSPAHFESYLARADFYTQMGKKDKAILDLNKAVTLSSNNPQAVLQRASFLLANRDFKSALADASRVLASESDNLQAADMKATILFSMGQYAQCMADCKKMLASNRWPHAYILRGLCEEKLKQLDKAKADLDVGVGLDPRNQTNLMLRYEFHNRNGMDEAAIDDLGRIINLYPNSLAKVKLFRERLRLYEKAKMDDPEKVKQDLGRIVELDPKDDDDRYRYALIAWRSDPQISMKDLNEAIALKPDIGKYYGLRGRLNADLNNAAQAIADCNKALESDAKDADVYAARGAAKLAQYKYDEAIADCEKAISLAPDTVAALYTEGQAYEGLSKPKDAAGFYNRFVEVAGKAAHRTREDDRRIEQAKRKVEIIQERAESAAPNSGGDATSTSTSTSPAKNK